MCNISTLQGINKAVVESALSIKDTALYKVMLFGSYARHDNTDESDVDYIVIFDDSKEVLKSIHKQMMLAADRISMDNDVVVSILVRDKNNFENSIDTVPLYKNIMKEGVSLYG